jgi:hypothetical protein
MQFTTARAQDRYSCREVFEYEQVDRGELVNEVAPATMA